MLNERMAVVYDGNMAKIMVDGVCMATVHVEDLEETISNLSMGGQR